jgi:hypothetical protein
MYTLNYDHQQLDRMHSFIRAGSAVRIIHVLSDQSDGFATHWEDRYIVLVDCEPKTYTLLCLL